MKYKKMLGFTLIELIIGIVISMSLISASTFYFKDFSRDEEMRNSINVLVSNIQFVKSERLYKDRDIFIISNTNNNNWNSYNIMEGGSVLEAFSLPNGYNMRGNVDGLSFRDDGFLIHDSGSPTGYNFVFTICDNKRSDEMGKRLEISVLGELIYEDVNC